MIASLFALSVLVGSPADLPLRTRDPLTRPHLLVVGTPHFGNPGRDLSNTSIPDVLTPDRQLEIEAVVDRLAKFKPTRIAVELGSKNQTKLDQRYADYRAGRYQLGPSETDQIALRLAAKLGLERVDAVDWNEMPPGTEADWNFISYAEAEGLQDRLAAVRAESNKAAAAAGRRTRCTEVTQWLRDVNSVDGRDAANRPYFDYALIGKGEQNPGATWVGNWYTRNLRIFANLVRLGSTSEDRILVIYGAGHGFLIDQFAEQSGAFVVHDTLKYLPEQQRFGRPGCA